MRIALIALLLMVPALAIAHPGHGHGGFGAGFIHPFLGLDHLLAMAGVGFWAAQQKRVSAVIGVCIAFLAAVLAGFALGAGTGASMLVELGIIGSLLVVGVLIFGARRLPVSMAISVAAVFALFHGHAHGAEMAAGLSAVAFAAGFALASSVLLGAGAALAHFAAGTTRLRPVERATGAVLVAASVYLLIVV